MKINAELKWFGLVFAAVSCCLLNSSCRATKFDLPSQEGKKLYTSYNIWYEKPDRIYAINYKVGKILPAGTEVTNVKYSSNEITFFVPSTSQNFTMTYREKFIKMPAHEFALRLFTSKTLEELTKGFTKEEKEFVENGALRSGLSKKAVMVGYGYPPAHRTPSLDSNTWLYWMTRFGKRQLIFDDKGKLISFN